MNSPENIYSHGVNGPEIGSLTEAEKTYWANVSTQSEQIIQAASLSYRHDNVAFETRWSPDEYPGALNLFGMTWGMNLILIRQAVDKLALETEYTLFFSTVGSRDRQSGSYTFKPFSDQPAIEVNGKLADGWAHPSYRNGRTEQQIHQQQLIELLNTFRGEFHV